MTFWETALATLVGAAAGGGVTAYASHVIGSKERRAPQRARSGQWATCAPAPATRAEEGSSSSHRHAVR